MAPESSDSESDFDSNTMSDEDDQLLYRVCGEAHIGANTNPYECLVGKYIVKPFLTPDDNEELFTGIIKHFDQKTKNFRVFYHADNFEEEVTAKTAQGLHEQFEHWYAKVSKSGQRFTRKQSLHVITGAAKKEANPIDLTAVADDEDPEQAKLQRHCEHAGGTTTCRMQKAKGRAWPMRPRPVSPAAKSPSITSRRL